jgi:hypothetical protein
MDPHTLQAHDQIGLWITIIAAAATFCSVTGAVLAKIKRRNQLFWFIGCFVFPPLLLLLILLGRSRPGREWPGLRPEDDENGRDSFILSRAAAPPDTRG